MAAQPTSNITFQNFFQATLTADITSSATDIFLDTVPNGTEGFLVIDPDSATAREIIYYNSKTATKVTCPSAVDGRGQDDTTASAHLTGTTVIMAPVAAFYETLLALFTTSPQGWTSLAGTFTGVTYNGNRNYTVTTSTDQRAVVSPGHRLRFTRTVTSPTQCTSLNGTTQYWSKTSPAGMTFTNFPVATAWVKLSSYNASDSVIQGRFDGTNGWLFAINASGQLYLTGYNGAVGNFNRVISYQSIPLNKWVHVAAQLDMSTATLDATHSWIMIDGVNVPASKLTAGTAPTSLLQGTGAYQVGAFNGANSLFAGKIAQAALFSATVSQTTIQAQVSQGLAGTETSLVSAYSFNGTANDLNTTNANNLSATASAGYVTDGPFAQGSTAVTGFTAGKEEFGIVAAVTASTINFNVPEGSAIPTSGGITSAYYSTYKVPYGFPADTGKWRIAHVSLAQLDSGALATTATGAFTGAKLNVPIGKFNLGYMVNAQQNPTSGNLAGVLVSLSTSSSAVTDTEMNSNAAFNSASAIGYFMTLMTRSKPVDVTSATDYFLISKNVLTVTATTYINVAAYASASTIFADNAYL